MNSCPYRVAIRLNWRNSGLPFQRQRSINSSVDPQQLKNSGNDASYERLEFLGDRVLGLIIAELLLDEFPDSAEGSWRLTGVTGQRSDSADVARNRSRQIHPYDPRRRQRPNERDPFLQTAAGDNRISLSRWRAGCGYDAGEALGSRFKSRSNPGFLKRSCRNGCRAGIAFA